MLGFAALSANLRRRLRCGAQLLGFVALSANLRRRLRCGARSLGFAALSANLRERPTCAAWGGWADPVLGPGEAQRSPVRRSIVGLRCAQRQPTGSLRCSVRMLGFAAL